jgi:hypothetical protein
MIEGGLSCWFYAFLLDVSCAVLLSSVFLYGGMKAKSLQILVPNPYQEK